MNPNNVYVTRAEMEQFVVKMMETHLPKMVADYFEKNILKVSGKQECENKSLK